MHRRNSATLVARRFSQSIVVVWLVLSGTYLLIHAAPGDPSALMTDPRISPRAQREMIRALGLDRSPTERYVTWSTNLVHGNLGLSFTYGKPVATVITAHLGASLLLGSSALLVGFGFGISLAVLTASRRRSLFDRLIGFAGLVLYSMPHFWLGMMAIMLLSYRFPLFPAGHAQSAGLSQVGDDVQRLDVATDLLHHLTLPTIVLAAPLGAAVCRLMRGTLAEVLESDVIRTARAKGLPRPRVLLVHAAPLALPSVIQMLGLSLPVFLSGLLVTETVFSWPGVGRLTYAAMLSRDYPLALGTTALTAVLVVVGTLLADTLHALSDPRIRLSFF